jgi:phosphoglycolate phosphatase-like HAD superfamily hydrolase
MQSYHNARTLFVDIDETLIHYEIDFDSLEGTILLSNDPTGVGSIRVKPIPTSIDMVKKFKAIGYDCFAWSQSGGDWAERVVKAVGLEDYFTACMSKPMWYLDDLEHTKWMGPRIDPYETKRK